MNGESKKRSLLKSLSWRISATLSTVGLVWLFTREIEVALTTGFFEVFLKFALYYIHERLWMKVAFGKDQGNAGVIWLTGLSGSGKSTVSKILLAELKSRGKRVEWLDGDVTREFVPMTGFTKEERDRHVLSTGFLARTLERNGVTVIASYISPFRETRQAVREMCRNFVEVHLATPLSVCEVRDVKGLYKKARLGEIPDFTGIDSPYEPPENPEIKIDTDGLTPEEVSNAILKRLKVLLKDSNE